MTPTDSGGAYQDVSEQQEQFRQAQRDAIGEALELPIADARERLEQLAADEQRWIAEQRRMLRELARQGRSTLRAGQAVSGVERELTAAARGHEGWSL